MAKRTFRQKPKSLLGTPYDSNLEKRLHEGVLNKCEFHTEKIPYVIEHLYQPDFIYRTNDSVFYLESKGYFQDSSELQKYIWVKKSLPEGHYLVFIFEKPSKPIHFQKKRKDNTKMTHEEWAQKNGFMTFDENNIKNLVDKEM